MAAPISGSASFVVTPTHGSGPVPVRGGGGAGHAMPPPAVGISASAGATTSSPPMLLVGTGVPSVTSATSPASVSSATSPVSVSSAFDSATSLGGAGDPNAYPSESSSGRTAGSGAALTPKEIELQRKRARDRKSQQAMRDRTKWTIFNLNEQVSFLTQMLSERSRDVNLLNSRMRMLETENAQLRTHNAALQLRLLSAQPHADLPVDPMTVGAAAAAAAGVAAATGAVSVAGTSPSRGALTPTAESSMMAAVAAVPKPPDVVKKSWEIPPVDGPPTCLSDQILQGFITSKVHQRSVDGALAFGFKPNLCSLLEKDRRTADAISDIVGDIVRSYFEIDTLPKQVAVFYIMCSLLKWMVVLDKPSWDLMPTWLRPTRSQITTPHAAWIDRIPWPNARNYLISHPDITLDHFAAVYSTSFSIRWPYDPSLVLFRAATPAEEVTINPVYEEHIRQLGNWEVGNAFRERYPEISELIDRDANTQSDHIFA